MLKCGVRGNAATLEVFKILRDPVNNPVYALEVRDWRGYNAENDSQPVRR